MKLTEVETEKPRYVIAELQEFNDTTRIINDIKSSINLFQKNYHVRIDPSNIDLKSHIEYTSSGIKGNINFKYKGKTLINYPKNKLPKYLLFTIRSHELRNISVLDSLNGFTEKGAN